MTRLDIVSLCTKFDVFSEEEAEDEDEEEEDVLAEERVSKTSTAAKGSEQLLSEKALSAAAGSERALSAQSGTSADVAKENSFVATTGLSVFTLHNIVLCASFLSIILLPYFRTFGGANMYYIMI